MGGALAYVTVASQHKEFYRHSFIPFLVVDHQQYVRYIVSGTGTHICEQNWQPMDIFTQVLELCKEIVTLLDPGTITTTHPSHSNIPMNTEEFSMCVVGETLQCSVFLSEMLCIQDPEICLLAHSLMRWWHTWLNPDHCAEEGWGSWEFS